jgi:hypothetical protein
MAGGQASAGLVDGSRLDPDDVWAIASAVAELLAVEDVAISTRRWLSPSEVAAVFGRSAEWVRDHATELGGRKIGGPRAPWRFPASCVEHVAVSPSALAARAKTPRRHP